MPGWSTLFEKAQAEDIKRPGAGAGIDYIAKQQDLYLRKISEITGRNVIMYFSAFLQRPRISDTAINDKDINALMAAIHKLDRSKGVDIILHTPGGDMTTTEQIIYYLHSAFSGNIRAIVPQMAMSAGSMIAVSCKSILMGRQSCLGPFDPQVNNMPSQSVVSEFYKAVNDVKNNPASLGLWQTIISKINPTFLTICEQANKLSEELSDMILEKSDYDSDAKKRIKEIFAKSSNSKTHSRHINRDRCKESGLHIEDLEASQELQDAVLSVHHCCMILAEGLPISKIVKNQIGSSYVVNIPQPVRLQPGIADAPRK